MRDIERSSRIKPVFVAERITFKGPRTRIITYDLILTVHLHQLVFYVIIIQRTHRSFELLKHFVIIHLQYIGPLEIKNNSKYMRVLCLTRFFYTRLDAICVLTGSAHPCYSGFVRFSIFLPLITRTDKPPAHISAQQRVRKFQVLRNPRYF